jgi:hypothetical protein
MIDAAMIERHGICEPLQQFLIVADRDHGASIPRR